MSPTAAHSPDALYPAHHEVLRDRYTRLLEATPFDAVAVYAGSPLYRFRDDQAWPFRAGVFYQQWVPCDDHAGAVLLFRPGRAPLLVLQMPRKWRRCGPRGKPPISTRRMVRP